jgi:serine/threonine-protein kinase
MPLSAGTRLGAYEIVGAIGAGGMGEVYRARDTQLKREVAIKVLPEAFSQDPDRLARFQREAELLATLNHPNIAAVYGLEKSEGVTAIVMELVDGETLAERIEGLRAKGLGLVLDEALPIARQIADALEAAHEKGVIHRDLKPANIKVTPDGKVKVLDFGLAKMIHGDGSRSGSTRDPSPVSMSPTLSVHGTYAGVILGTAAYMSPEQARGRVVDKRTDVWAFGCVLFEMISGARPFDGEDVAETIGAVIHKEPAWTQLPVTTQHSVRTVLQRCLEKDPKQRIRDIGDVQLALGGAFDSPAPTIIQPALARRPLWRRAVSVGVVVILVGAMGLIAGFNIRPAAPLPRVTRFPITLPAGALFTGGRGSTLALSPDGTQILYLSGGSVHLRAMSQLDARTILGTDGQQPLEPVFSPDGQSIAFATLSDNTIKRIAVTGGAPVTICPAEAPFGMSWGVDGIVFGQGSKGILRVSPNGGKPELLVKVKADEVAHGPHILPGGGAVLFTLAKNAGADRWDKAQVVVQSLKSGERKILVEGGSDARYVPSGHLVYARGGVLFAVPFDLRRLEVTGGPVPIVEGVRRSVGGVTGAAQVSISDTGSAIYIPGAAGLSSAQLDLALVDRNGAVEPLKLPPASYDTARVSPDGKQVAFGTDDGREAVVWVYDVSGATSMRRLSFGGRNRFPIWSADGQRVAFQSDREGDAAIFWQRADGTGTAERLTKPEQGTSHIPESWSPKGDVLLFRVTKEPGVSLWTFTPADKKAALFGGVQSSVPTDAVFSPDGRWVAYSSSETGPITVYVQPFPATGAKYQVSRGDGGRHPVWSRDGKDLRYVVPGATRYAVATVNTQPAFTFTNPVPAPRVFQDSVNDTIRTFDVTPDGRFLGVIAAGQTQAGTAVAQIQVVLNWFEELKARVPTK